ncbi:MAG: hypothetical protein ACRDNS_00510 [Trebonia sp.]
MLPTAVMTLALAGAVASYVVTGLALRPTAPAGRLVLMSGGAATMPVAVFPETNSLTSACLLHMPVGHATA